MTLNLELNSRGSNYNKYMKTIPNFKEEVKKHVGNKSQFLSWVKSKIKEIETSGIILGKESYNLSSDVYSWLGVSSDEKKDANKCIIALELPTDEKEKKTAGGLYLPDSATPQERVDTKIFVLLPSNDPSEAEPVLARAYGHIDIGNGVVLIQPSQLLLRYKGL